MTNDSVTSDSAARETEHDSALSADAADGGDDSGVVVDAAERRPPLWENWRHHARTAAIVAVPSIVLAIGYVMASRQAGWWLTFPSWLIDHATTLLMLSALLACVASWLPELTKARTLLAAMWRSTVGACVGLTSALVLGLTPALQSWRDAEWSFSKIGGTVPWSDATGYHVGGLKLLHAETLDRFTGRRPLNAGFYAVRMAATGSNYWLALLLQGALLGAAILLVLRVIAGRLGAAAALVVAAVILPFANDTVDTTLSEPLGLTVGCLAAAVLLIGAFERRTDFLLGGVCLMTIGLDIRAGAYFAIAAAVVYLAVDRTWGRRFDWRRGALAVAAVLAGFVMNVPISAAYSDGSASLNGNFSYTLYGLAHGGTGWYSAKLAFDENAYPTEKELTDAIYDAAFEQIKDHPGQLVKGIWKGYDEFFDRGAFDFVPDPWDTVLELLTLIGAAAVLLSGRRRVGVLFVGLALGTIASAPFVFQDGGFRVFAATIPMMALLPALALSALQRPDDSRGDWRSWLLRGGAQRWAAGTDAGLTRAATGSAIVAVAILLVGPFVAVTLAGGPIDQAAINCAPGEVPVAGDLSAATPHVTPIPDASGPRNFGEVDADAFRRGAESPFNEIGEPIAAVEPGTSVVLMWNELPDSQPNAIVVLPTEELRAASGAVELCGTPVGGPAPRDYAYLATEEVHPHGG